VNEADLGVRGGVAALISDSGGASPVFWGGVDGADVMLALFFVFDVFAS
jgi:hypothetical protein